MDLHVPIPILEMPATSFMSCEDHAPSRNPIEARLVGAKPAGTVLSRTSPDLLQKQKHILCTPYGVVSHDTCGREAIRKVGRYSKLPMSYNHASRLEQTLIQRNCKSRKLT